MENLTSEQKAVLEKLTTQDVEKLQKLGAEIEQIAGGIELSKSAKTAIGICSGIAGLGGLAALGIYIYHNNSSSTTDCPISPDDIVEFFPD